MNENDINRIDEENNSSSPVISGDIFRDEAPTDDIFRENDIPVMKPKTEDEEEEEDDDKVIVAPIFGVAEEIDAPATGSGSTGGSVGDADLPVIDLNQGNDMNVPEDGNVSYVHTEADRTELQNSLEKEEEEEEKKKKNRWALLLLLLFLLGIASLPFAVPAVKDLLIRSQILNPDPSLNNNETGNKSTTKRITTEITTTEPTTETTTSSTTTTAGGTTRRPANTTAGAQTTQAPTTTTVPTTTKQPTVVIVEPKNLDIVFENVSTSEATKPVLIDGAVKFDIVLNQPGDTYEFTMDVYNKGTIDAAVESYVSNNLTSQEAKYISFALTYADGTPIQKGDSLKSKQRRKLKFVATYKNVDSADDLPSQDVRVPYSGYIIFVQG